MRPSLPELTTLRRFPRPGGGSNSWGLCCLFKIKSAKKGGSPSPHTCTLNPHVRPPTAVHTHGRIRRQAGAGPAQPGPVAQPGQNPEICFSKQENVFAPRKSPLNWTRLDAEIYFPGDFLNFTPGNCILKIPEAAAPPEAAPPHSYHRQVVYLVYVFKIIAHFHSSKSIVSC